MCYFRENAVHVVDAGRNRVIYLDPQTEISREYAIRAVQGFLQ